MVTDRTAAATEQRPHFPIQPDWDVNGPRDGRRKSKVMDRLVDLLIEKNGAAYYWPQLFVLGAELLMTLDLSGYQSAAILRRLNQAATQAAAGDFSAADVELRMVRTLLA